MALTVRELTEIPYLRTRIHAGESGADRKITWAHSCETERPWEWLEKGDLLMTVGLGIPVAPQAQVAYVEGLAAVEVSGLTIGADMRAPPLSEEMLAAADEHGLPILFTAFEVPFIQISRTVAGASHGPEHLKLVKTVRIYDSMRAAAVQSSSPAELLETLGDEIGCSLFVCTNACGAVIPGGVEMGEPVREAFRAATAVRGGQAMPGILRLAVGDRTALVTPVPTQRPVSLVAVPLGSEAPAYVILQHVATVVALECERLFAAREESRRLGAEILAGLLDARITPHSAAQRLETQGFSEAPMVAVVSAPAGALSGVLHHDFAERGIRHLLLRRGEHLYCLTAADDDVVATTTSLMTAEGGRAGISDPFTDFATVTSAVREARWALEVARTEGRVVCRYGEQLGAVGPRSLTEAKALVDRVLGPVIAYDRDKGTELIASLAAFLRANRSWQQAAEELHVHKQTLVYRMRRVEELTGRKLADTCTLSDFWFAVRAFELAGA